MFYAYIEWFNLFMCC